MVKLVQPIRVFEYEEKYSDIMSDGGLDPRNPKVQQTGSTINESLTVAEPVCKTCGGSRVDPGGLPICRDCGPQQSDEPWEAFEYQYLPTQPADGDQQ